MAGTSSGGLEKAKQKFKYDVAGQAGRGGNPNHASIREFRYRQREGERQHTGVATSSSYVALLDMCRLRSVDDTLR